MEIENPPTVDQAMPPLPKRVPTPIGLRLRDFMRGPGQFLVWIGVGLTGLWVAGTAVPTPQLVGVVTSTEVAHAFGQAGLLAAVLVEEGDEVKPGDPIARLDSGPLEAQLSVAEQQLAAVLADVTALAASQALAAAERLLAIGESDAELVQDGQANRSRVRDEVWRLQIEARERRLAILALEVEIERDLLKADQVRVQAERLTPLVDQGFGRAAEKQDLELEERTLLGQ
ncbi:MAG: biotin/lipoyl-binding protein, partial [Planctomycetota bacterium]